MVKLFIGLLIMVIAVLLGVLFVKNDPGFVLIRYGEFSLETSLAFGVVAVAVAGVALQLMFRLLLALWRLPKTLARQAERRRIDKSRKLLNIGLIDLAEGRFEQSEAKLLKLIEHAENPLLNYLAAARAAQNLSKYDQRDNYLKAAHEVKPEAEIAIGVTQAELQLSSNQTERALATLTHLRSLAPRHDYVVKLLAKVYFQIEEWALLCDLLPEVRKKKLFKEEQLQQMETKVFSGCLSAAAIKEGESLEKTWNKIPKNYQANATLILHYIRLLSQHRKDNRRSEQLLVKAIDQQWDNRLIACYGKLELEDSAAQLVTAEKWLQDYGSSDVLLLALGRICIRLKLWGKAQSYLEASIGVRPGTESCLELARLLNSKELNEAKEACKFYRQGLELCQTDTDKGA
ncbi:MAG: heme biosynthesis protein HemY [Gammaproteobacteria bacterium]|nr:heme biosynthesis protein HemY [Gammaproteobacteria bacterium]MBL7000067.1 heme biosynthesis protein HemY [Gammaproteobacteria bacterium]